MKQYRLYIVVAALGIALIVFLQSLAPKPINWEPTYSKRDRIPYGGYILHDLLPKIGGDVEVTTVQEPVYTVLTERFEGGPATYLFLNGYLQLDEYDIEQLLDFVHAGNTAFIASERLPEMLEDTLGLELETHWTYKEQDSIGISLVNPSLRGADDYTFGRTHAWRYFSQFDTAEAIVLGINQHGAANYVRIGYGDGIFLINLVPAAFTNVSLVDPTHSGYVFAALSYLPVGEILWDEYYKVGRQEAQTPLRFILSDQSLRWAYWLLIVTIILYVIFEGKRRQRIIPVIEPVKNTTLEFVDTVGRLYHQHGDHRNIAEKKIAYLLEYIRSNLNERAREIDADFCERVAVRTGIDQEQITRLFDSIRSALAKPVMTEEHLTELNTHIEHFYRRTNQNGNNGRTN